MENLRQAVTNMQIKQYKKLKYLALWKLSPDSSNYLKAIYKIYFWYLFIFWILLFDVLMIIQVIISIRSIGEVIKVLVMLATAIAVLGKFLTVKLKNHSYENYFETTLKDDYLPRSPEERNIFMENVNLNGKMYIFYRNISYVALSSFIIGHYISGKTDLPTSFYSPLDLNIKWKYNLMYIYACLSMCVLCWTNVAFDTLSASFFIHLKGQLDILGHRLESVDRNENSSQHLISEELKECVRYYNKILKLSHEIENLVSNPMSLQIACSVFVLIANFYAMSLLSISSELGSLFKMAPYQACMLSQIFILCYFANEVSLKSSEISFNLYESNWFKWNKINQKFVLLMMLRFETPIRISSINRCYSFNLAAFTSIVNSSYSYFALLKRVNN